MAGHGGRPSAQSLGMCLGMLLVLGACEMTTAESLMSSFRSRFNPVKTTAIQESEGEITAADSFVSSIEQTAFQELEVVADEVGKVANQAATDVGIFESPPPAPAGFMSSCSPLSATTQDLCAYVHDSGDCFYERLDYLGFHYCTMMKKYQLPSWVSLLVLIPWMLTLFAGIGLAAGLFFAPAVGVMAESLKLPPDVAGATLLAYGNGAADFFTQMAAITLSNEVDVPLALGESVGAGIYVCTFVLALVILVSPKTIKMTSGPYVRDTFFYAVAIALTAYVTHDLKIELYESAGLIVWYFCYLFAVFGGSRLHPSAFLVHNKEDYDEDSPLSLAWKEDEVFGWESTTEYLAQMCRPWEMSPVMALLSPIITPVLLLQSLTSPLLVVRRVSKMQAIVCSTIGPVFSYAVFVVNVHDVTMTNLYVMLALAGVGCLLAVCTYPSKGLNPLESKLLTGLALIQAIAWMDICADELVAVLETIGRILGLPDAFLGATLLAWGASAGDTAALLTITRLGHGSMAITACFAGPLFQLLVGTGSCLMFVNLKEGSVLMSWGSNLFAMFGFAGVLMLFLGLVVPLYFKCRFTPSLAYMLFVFFIAYATLISATGFGIITIV